MDKLMEKRLEGALDALLRDVTANRQAMAKIAETLAEAEARTANIARRLARVERAPMSDAKGRQIPRPATGIEGDVQKLVSRVEAEWELERKRLVEWAKGDASGKATKAHGLSSPRPSAKDPGWERKRADALTRAAYDLSRILGLPADEVRADLLEQLGEALTGDGASFDLALESAKEAVLQQGREVSAE